MKKADRQKVFDKCGGRCAYCGCQLEKGWHVDHFESVGRKLKYNHKSGRLETTGEMDRPENHCIENMMPSCPSCNRLKHSQSLEGFRLSIQQFINSLNQYINQYKFAKKFGLVEETEKPVVFYFETMIINDKG